jgi:hypothetical protein
MVLVVGCRDSGVRGQLTGWPEPTLRRRHVKEIGDEETMVVGLLALQADTRPAFIQAVGVVAVDSQPHYLRLLVDGVQAPSRGVFPTLIPDFRLA